MKKLSQYTTLLCTALVSTIVFSGMAGAKKYKADRCKDPSNWVRTAYFNNAGIYFSQCGPGSKRSLWMHPARGNFLSGYSTDKNSPFSNAAGYQYGVKVGACNMNDLRAGASFNTWNSSDAITREMSATA